MPSSPKSYADVVKEEPPATEAPPGVPDGGVQGEADVLGPEGEQDGFSESKGWGSDVHGSTSGEDGFVPHTEGERQADVPEKNGGDRVSEVKDSSEDQGLRRGVQGESMEKFAERDHSAPEANGNGQAEVAKDENQELGFARDEMYSKPLVGSVQLYKRHVFLCFKDAESWPSQVEASEERLPRSFASALKARRESMPVKTRLTVCEARTDSSNGDVLIFPDMVAYKGLSHTDVDSFVDQVLVHGHPWNKTASEHLTASYVFVCSHSAKDRRCGFCGPILIERFEQEIEKAGLVGQVVVRACSHIGGHKYAGNVIIFRPSEGEGKQAHGHWFGYVTPDDVPVLLEEHIGKGEIIERLWRGQMGVGEAEQKESQSRRMELKEAERECACAKSIENGVTEEYCCKTVAAPVVEPFHTSPEAVKHAESVLTSETSRWFKVPSWVQTWERGDTLATLAVIGAASAVVAAYYVVKATKD